MNRNLILNILREEARKLQIGIVNLKQLKADSWAKAVPNTAQGGVWFQSYSHSRTLLTNARRKLRMVNESIRHIKKNIK